MKDTIEQHLAAGHKIEIEPSFLTDPKKAKDGRFEIILFVWAFWSAGATRRLKMSKRFVDSFERETAEEADTEIARLVELPGVTVMSKGRSEDLLHAYRNGRVSELLQ